MFKELLIKYNYKHLDAPVCDNLKFDQDWWLMIVYQIIACIFLEYCN